MSDEAKNKAATTLIVITLKHYSKEGEVFGGPDGFATRAKKDADRAAAAIASLMDIPAEGIKVRSYTGWNGAGVGPAKILVVPYDVELL